MKKFLVFALVLVSACMLFADNTIEDMTDKDLKLKVTVGENSSSKWAEKSEASASGEGKSLDAIWHDMEEYTAEEYAGLSNGNTYSVYPSVKTNINKQVVMTVSGEALHADGVETKITVKATGVGADTDKNYTEWTSTSSDGTIVWTEDENAPKDGNRIISQELQISMDQDSYNKALASVFYEATLKLSVTVNA